ncbi:hypothetical protein ACC763_39125, partial [Rhizobium ruizarguesonis]
QVLNARPADNANFVKQNSACFQGSELAALECQSASGASSRCGRVHTAGSAPTGNKIQPPVIP